METFNLGDGLIVTVVAMIVVFAVLASLWFLVELVHKLVGEPARGGFGTDSPRRMIHSPVCWIRAWMNNEPKQRR
jgi:Na+-transporting methylmalonyl-CoA/oxaloacetate decarboxylase gamma subunit